MASAINESLLSLFQAPRNESIRFGSEQSINIYVLELHLAMTAMMKYVPPILLAIGTPANILLVSVLRRESFRDVSAYFYIQTFAVANVLSLVFGMGADWISFISNRPSIEITSDFSCRFWMFLTNVITYSVVWFVVGMAIDRYVYIWHTRRANSLCTVFFAKIGVIIIMTGLVVVSVNAMWSFQLEVEMKGSQSKECYVSHRHNDVFAMAWPWVSASFYLLIPLSLIFTFTILIALGICFRRQPSTSRHGQLSNSRDSVKTVLTVCLCYFIQATPMTVMTLFEYHFPADWRYDSVLLPRFQFLVMVFRFVAAANYVTCSLILLLCVSVLRRTAWQILKECLSRCKTSLKRTEWQKVDLHSDRDPKTPDSCTMTTPL